MPLECRHAVLNVRDDDSVSLPVLPRTGTIGDALARCIETESEHIILTNDDGTFCGILALSEIEDAVREWGECPFWTERCVEQLLPLTLDPPERQPEQTDRAMAERSDCVTIEDNGGLSALLVDDNAFVNWGLARDAVARTAIDAVTLLPNRAHFNRRLQEESQRCQRLKQTMALAVLDVDHFKAVNDNHGHAQGDAVLQTLAKCCAGELREYDFIARYGGDEFAVLFSIADPAEVVTPVRRILTAVQERGLQAGPEKTVTVSIGVATVSSDAGKWSTEDLFEAADQAVYRSKAAGRNCAHIVPLNRQSDDSFQRIHGRNVEQCRDLTNSELAASQRHCVSP